METVKAEAQKRVQAEAIAEAQAKAKALAEQKANSVGASMENVLQKMELDDREKEMESLI